MLTRAQTDAIREHVVLDEHTRELIRLACADLYHGPIHAAFDGEDLDRWPGFPAACEMIREAVPRTDLYLDVEIDEVIGDEEPHWHGPGCGCVPDTGDEVTGYYPEHVLRVDSRDVVRALVGSELARYV
jgi:hypothetical protein